MTADRDLIVSDTIANKIRGYILHLKRSSFYYFRL